MLLNVSLYNKLILFIDLNKMTTMVCTAGDEAELLVELDALMASDGGAWTEWMNTDHPDPSRGSTGDYEWVLEARIEEILDGNCLIPCEDDKIMAMEVDIPAVDDDATFCKSF